MFDAIISLQWCVNVHFFNTYFILFIPISFLIPRCTKYIFFKNLEIHFQSVLGSPKWKPRSGGGGVLTKFFNNIILKNQYFPGQFSQGYLRLIVNYFANNWQLIVLWIDLIIQLRSTLFSFPAFARSDPGFSKIRAGYKTWFF